MPKYLLPCECGKATAIDASQAGQQLACECGKQIEIPTLRGVRALEPMPDETSSSPGAADWDSSRGMMFSGSLVLFVIGAAVSYFGYEGLRVTPNVTREDETHAFEHTIDDMSLDDVYEAWKSIRERGLEERGQNVYVNIRNFRAGRKRILATGITFCVVALLGAIGAMLVRRKTTA